MEPSTSEDGFSLISRRSISSLSVPAKSDLRARVRSHLILREHFIPPTPVTLSEYIRRPSVAEGSSATGSEAEWSLLRETSKGSAKRRPSPSSAAPMAIHNFDGPAGQAGTEGYDAPRRHLGQSDLLQRTGERAESTKDDAQPEINQRHPGITSQEQGGSAELPPIPQRSPFNRNRYKPNYDVKTLSPAIPGLMEKHSRPSMQHIPGSYGSELTINTQRVSGSVSTVSPLEGGVDEIDPQPLGSHDTFYSSAKESLSHAQEQKGPLPANRPSVRSVRSNTSLKSNFSTRTLFKPHANHPHAREIAQPIVTPSIHQSSRGDDVSAPTFTTNNQAEPKVEFRSLEPDFSKDNHETTLGLAPVTDTPITDLLAQSPPITQTTVEGHDLHCLTPPLASETKQTLSPQVFREHSREVSSHDEREDQAFKDRSDLPSKSAQPSDRIPKEGKTFDVAKAPSPSTPGTPMSSASHKAASLSRALKALSDISSSSNGSRIRLRSLHSPSKYEKLDDHTDEPNVQGYSQNAEPRSSWVQSFIGRSPTSHVPGTTSLTSRPSQRRIGNPGTTELSRSRTVPARQGPSATSDENVLQNQSVRDAMKNLAIAKQQQHNAESFSKVILDLENLLEEALVIAHQAADGNKSRISIEQDHHYQPNDVITSDFSHDTSSDDGSMHADGVDGEEHYISDPKTSQQLYSERITVVEPEDGDRYHGHFRKARDATPYPSATRSASMVPSINLDESVDNEPRLEGGLKRVHTQAPQQPLTVPGQSKFTNDNGFLQPFASRDFAVPKRQPTMKVPGRDDVPLLPRQPTIAQAPLKEQNAFLARKSDQSSNDRKNHAGQPRARTFQMRPERKHEGEAIEMERILSSRGRSSEAFERSDSDYSEEKTYRESDKPTTATTQPRSMTDPDARRESTLSPLPDRHLDLEDQGPIKHGSIRKGRRSHFSIKEPHGFSLSRSHKPAPIARDWSNSRKRWTAFIACLSTALIGLIIGIYAGEVPAIQYAIVDEHHYTILGNVVFFLGLAITTILFFPLPLLHGRKPYTLAALAILMPLQFPQALAVNTQRTPSTATYRVGLLLSRSIAGLVAGFATINFLATLLDLFGASLQSSNPYQEEVDVNDVRRHGGGMGMWLGIWTWCFIGSIGVGFFIGAVIISGLDVSWGFWITIILTAAVLVLNVLAPETRRSAYRRSLAEVRNGGEVSRRIARGEIKMHLDATGPIYWWEEVTAGWRLCIGMLKQPGFAVLALYLGWIYGQIVIVIVVSDIPAPKDGSADSILAIGCSHLQILPLPTPICWSLRRGGPNRGPPCHTVPEGISAESFKNLETQNR